MATYSQEMTRGLRERGLRVTFFHHGGDEEDGDGTGEIDEVPLASVSLVKPLVFSPPSAKRNLLDRLARGGFDLVHASFWFSSLDFELPREVHELGIPIAATFHVAFDNRLSLWGGITKATYRLYARSLAHCDRVIVFGEAQREMLAEMGVPAKALRVLPNGVDVEKYTPGESDARRRFDADRLFVYMGRVDAEKNVDTLIRAFLAASPGPRTRLVVMGSGSERKRLQRAFSDPRVVFTGHIADEARRIEVLRGCDGFFLASSVEGLSLSMLEAMACGAPTVATDVGSDGDALRGAGIVIDPVNLESDLRLAFRELMDIPDLPGMLGAAARRRAVERYSLERNLDSLVGLYRELAPA